MARWGDPATEVLDVASDAANTSPPAISCYSSVTTTLQRDRARNRVRAQRRSYAFKQAVDQALGELEDAIAGSHPTPLGLRGYLGELAQDIGYPKGPPRRGGPLALHDYALELQEHEQTERRGRRVL